MSNNKSGPPTLKNRKARFNYSIEETYEAGLALRGTEVKSLRQGKANFTDAYIYTDRGEAWLLGMYIKPYKQGSYQNHDPRRKRKLLLHKSQIRELAEATDQQGYSIVPLKLYFKQGYAKLLIGLGRGKKKYDKREDMKKKDARREIERKVKGSYKINV